MVELLMLYIKMDYVLNNEKDLKVIDSLMK